MPTKRPFAAAMIASLAFAIAGIAGAMPMQSSGCFNLSGFYMGADDSDLYSDFAGVSLKIGVYVTETTELFGECMFGDALDMPEEIDYSTNIGLLLGITQYLPLSDQAALYVRAKGGVTINTWEYESAYDMYSDDGYEYSRADDEETDTYLTGAIGAGVSVGLSEMVSLEVGYDYVVLDVSDQFGDDEVDADDTAAYHTVHAGLDIEF